MEKFKRDETAFCLPHCFLSEFILPVSIKGLSLHNSFLSKHFIFRKRHVSLFFFLQKDYVVSPHLKAVVLEKK